ncbi:MAG: hypothetical protein GKC04_00370 [Methanomicrobiales archaeon]|nr:hypothetical protein [Methanomicrobiales archaeon]
MSLITDAVAEFQAQLCGSGCEDNNVTLKRAPEGPACQYPRGAIIAAQFGGKTAHITTNFPVEATTRISFLFGSALETPLQRAAALALINVSLGFLCLERRINACPSDAYPACLSGLAGHLEGRRIALLGSMPAIERSMPERIVDDPAMADVILVTGDALCSDNGLAVCDAYRDSGRLLFLGPETSGICSLLSLAHWCPYGRSSLENGR